MYSLLIMDQVTIPANGIRLEPDFFETLEKETLNINSIKKRDPLFCPDVLLWEKIAAELRGQLNIPN